MIALPHRAEPLIIAMTWSNLRSNRASLNMYSVVSICVEATPHTDNTVESPDDCAAL